MPIRINLLNEALAEEDLRRRDPVKQAIYLGGFLVVLSLVWFSSTWLKFKMVQSSLSQVESEIQTHTNANDRVQSDMKLIAENQRRLDALTQLSESRFLQGNLLNALQQIYVPNVQLIRLRLDQSYDRKEGTAAKTTGSGVIPGRPGTVTEHITLTLDAKDTSPNPGDQVNRYKDALAKSVFLNPSPGQKTSIRLSSLSPAQTSGNGKPFVLFTFECRLPDKTR